MSIKLVDSTDRSIAVKMFRKYGSCMIEYLNFVPIFSYKDKDKWVVVKPSEYHKL